MARRYRVAPMSGLRARPAALAGNGFPKTLPSVKTVAQICERCSPNFYTSSIVLGISSIHPACPCRGSGPGPLRSRATGSPKRHRLQRRWPKSASVARLTSILRQSYSVLRQSSQFVHRTLYFVNPPSLSAFPVFLAHKNAMVEI